MIRGADGSRHGIIPVLDKIGYGMGNFGYGIILQIIGTYLVFYSSAVLNVPGRLIGMAVAVSIIWDAVTDPLMGYISDGTISETFGRRHKYILMGCIFTAFSNYTLWIISPDLPESVKIIWVLMNLIVIKGFTTIFSTPYAALGAELSYDYNERTSIQSIKTIFFLLGMMFGIVAGMFIFFQPTEEFQQGQLNPHAYAHMGLASSASMMIFGLVAFFSTKKYIPFLPKLQNDHDAGRKNLTGVFISFITILKNKNYKYIVLAYLFTNISTALISTLGMHVFTYTFLMDSSHIAVIFGIQFFISIVSQPIWTSISGKMDKKPSVTLGLMISLAGCFMFILLVLLKDSVRSNFLYLLPFAAVTGFGTAGLFSIPQSMIADTIDVAELNTGKRTEGVYYGSLTLFNKLSQSIAVFLLGLLLDFVRFDPALEVQSESTTVILGLIIPVGGAIGFVSALISLMGYNLNKIKINSIQRELLSRRLR